MVEFGRPRNGALARNIRPPEVAWDHYCFGLEAEDTELGQAWSGTAKEAGLLNENPRSSQSLFFSAIIKTSSRSRRPADWAKASRPMDHNLLADLNTQHDVGALPYDRQLQESTLADYANIGHFGLAVIGFVESISLVPVTENGQAFVTRRSLEQLSGNIGNEIARRIDGDDFTLNLLSHVSNLGTTSNFRAKTSKELVGLPEPALSGSTLYGCFQAQPSSNWERDKDSEFANSS